MDLAGAMVFGRADLLGRVNVIILILGLLALFLLPHPWNDVAFAAAFGWEIATILFLLWYSQRGRAQVGSETLIGQSALVITACFPTGQDRKSTRLNSSHVAISYAVFCLK